MDFHSMKRKQLQALCKRHKIPANLSNIELANRLTEFLKERENQVIKAQEEENMSEIESNDEVLNKKGKKVRFSPDHELIELTRSLVIKRRSRRNSVLSSDSIRSVEIVESGERNKETVSRRGSAIRTGESNLTEAEVKHNKRGGKAVKGTAKGDEQTSDIKNEEIVNNDCRVTRSRAQKLKEASVVEEKRGRKVVKNIGKVAVVRAETDDGRGGTSSDSSSKRGDEGGEKPAIGLDRRIKGNGKGPKESKQSAGDRLTVKLLLPLRRSKRKSNTDGEFETDEVEASRKTSKRLASDGSQVDTELGEIQVNPSKNAVLKIEEPIQKVGPRRSNRRKTMAESGDRRGNTESKFPLRSSLPQSDIVPEVSKESKMVIQPVGAMRRSRHKTLCLKLVSAADTDSTVGCLKAENHTSKRCLVEKENDTVGDNTRPRRNNSKGKPLGPLEKVGGDCGIQENKEMKRKRGHVSGGENNNDLNSGAESLKRSSSKKVVFAAATREFADDRKQPHTPDHPNSPHISSGTGESLFMDVQPSVSKDSNVCSRNITDVEVRESHKKKEEVSIADGAESSSTNLTSGEDLVNSDTNAASKTAEKGTNSPVTDDQNFTSKVVEVESSELRMEVDAVESIEKNITDMDKNDNEAQVYIQMEDSGSNNQINDQILAEGLDFSGKEGSAETCSSGDSFLLCDEIDIETDLKVAEAEVDDHHNNLEASSNILENKNEDTSQAFGEDGASESCSMTRHHGDDVAEARATELADRNASNHFTALDMPDISHGEKDAIFSTSTDVNLERDHEDDHMTKNEEQSMYAETRESESSKSKCDDDGEFSLTKLFDEEGMNTPQGKENLSDEQGMSHDSPSVLVCNSAGDHEANLLLSAEGGVSYNLTNKQSELTEAYESECLTSYKKSSNSQEINPSTPSETQADTEADELVQPCLRVVDPNNDLKASSNILENKNEDTSQTSGEDGAFESLGMTRHHGDNVAEGSEPSFPKGRASELNQADKDGCLKDHRDASDHFIAFDMPDQSYCERDARIALPDRGIFADSTDVNLKRDHEDDQMTKTEERYVHEVADTHESDSSKGLKSKCDEDGGFSLTELFDEDGGYGFTPQEKENLSGGYPVKYCNELGKAHGSPSILKTMCNSPEDREANLSPSAEGGETYNLKNKQSELTEADESGYLKNHKSSNSQETNPYTPSSVSETQAEKQKSILAKSDTLASSNQRQGAWSNTTELAGNEVSFLKSFEEKISQVPEALSPDGDDKEASANATISDVQSCLISKIAAESLCDVKSQDSVENAHRHKNVLARQTNAADEAIHATSRQSWTEIELQNLFETSSVDDHPGQGDTFYQGSVTANISGRLTEKQDTEMDADIYENEFKVLLATPVKIMTPCKIEEAYSHDSVTSIKGCSNAMKENVNTESTSCDKTQTAGYEVENNSSITASLSNNGGDDICEAINEVKSFELLNTSTRVLSEAEYDGCEAGLACCLEHESTFEETKETDMTSQDLNNIVAPTDHNSSVHNAESKVLSSSEMHLHLRDENSTIKNLDVGKPVFILSVDNDKMDSAITEEISTAEMIQFSIQEFHSEEKKEDSDDIPNISNQPASRYNGILRESDVADTINEYIDSESSISVMFENSSAGHATNSKHEENASSVDGLNIEIQELEQATLLTRPVGFLDQGSTVKLESQKKIESEDGQNTSIELHSTTKNNARTILIHGTPGKLLSMADMKENTVTQKRSNIGDITAVRPAKRKALQDLQWK